MGPVCVPAKAAFLGVPAAGLTAAAVAPDLAVALLIVLLVAAVSGVAWFVILMRQPVWRPEPRRLRAIPSYRVTAVRAAATTTAPQIAARHVIDGTGLVIRDEMREGR